MEIYFIITFISLASASPLSTKKYRSDYVYAAKTDAFYKLHIESLWNQRAQDTCSIEGATLMMPSSPLDIIQAHSMMKQFPDIGNFLWVGDDEMDHESAEEQAVVDLDMVRPNDAKLWMTTDFVTCEVMTRNGDIQTSGCYRMHPFICKVEAKDAPYNSHCQVFASGYNYFKNVGSCYKFATTIFSWDQAYDECRAEGAHLAVINSVLEKQVIQNISRVIHLGLGTTTPWNIYVGVRAEKKSDGSPRVFKTIFGQTLAEAGFDEWSSDEPNNAGHDEDCVSFHKIQGKYNDVACRNTNSFICEKEVNLNKKKN